MNVGISNNFGVVDREQLRFPATMSVDYVRVYQPKGQVNVGCSPKEFPTEKYIET
jgi:beta-glucan synthesis-associated protein KRE6